MQPSAADRHRVTRSARLVSLLVTLGLLASCSSTPSDDRVARDTDEDSPQIALEYDPISDSAAGADDPDGPGTFVDEPARNSKHPVVEVVPATGRNNRAAASSDVVAVRTLPGNAPEKGTPEEGSPSDGRDPPAGDTLVAQQRHAIERLGVLVELQRPLDDLERASMQDYIIQLVALHDLEVGDSTDYRDVLIKAADRLVQPSRRVRFRMAAFFEDIGISDRVDKLWPTGTKELTVPEKGDDSFAIVRIEPSSVIRRGVEREFDLGDLEARDDVRLLATLEGLTSKAVAGGYQYKYSVEAFIYDDKDEYRGHKPVVKNQVEFSARPLDPPVVSISYTIDSRHEAGNYRLELKITDEFSGEQDLESVALRIRPRSTQ